MEGQEPRAYQARLDASGRIVLPAEVRERHDWSEGDAVIVVDDERGVQVKSFDRVVAEAQAYVLSFIPQDVQLVDELLAERRADAARE
jgi:AbrB family looped-hinge helix DNA binding protein